MDSRETITRNLMMLWFFLGQQRGRGHRGGFGQDGPLDPTRGRGRIIAMLRIKDGLSAKELAQVLGIRVSSLNETLAKMEKDGLVTRTPSEADKRVILVSLTDAGRAIEVNETDGPDMLAGFSEEELEQLEGYLARMLENVESSLDADFVSQMHDAWEARAQFMDAASGGFRGGPAAFWGGGGPHTFRKAPFASQRDMPMGANPWDAPIDLSSWGNRTA